MTRICLFMIVKNEEKIIERCLNSTVSFVDDYVITDTGSTDKTVEIVQSFINKNNKDGHVFIDPWKDFGYNRTKSMKNAKEWLKNKERLRDTTYLLTIDADMILTSFSKEDQIAVKESLVDKDMVYMIQKNSFIEYYNIRLFKSTLNFECFGTTHEYWDYTDEDVKNNSEDNIYKIKLLWIEDKGDGGSKTNKYERDIKLLEEGIKEMKETKENKRNMLNRYTFYLAQSYHDLGNYERAVYYYNKRIELEGWIEEVYISYKRLGTIYLLLNFPDNALDMWLKAYELLPKRSETLYYMAYYYIYTKNDTRDINKAYYLLTECLKIPYPEDCILFIEKSIYDYKIMEELSIICSNFTSEIDIEVGLKACRYLIYSKNEAIPQFVKQNSLKRYINYIKRLQPVEHRIFSLPEIDYYNSSSMCLIRDNEGIVRYVNYKITKEGDYIPNQDNEDINTENYWFILDKDNKDNNLKKFYKIENLCMLEKNRNYHIQGIEDIRICMYRDKLYGLGVSWEYGKTLNPGVLFLSFEETEGTIYIKDIKPLEYASERCQKNWTMFVNKYTDRLTIVYSHSPLTLLIYDEDLENFEIIKIQSSYDLSQVRGSSNPVYVGDNLIFLVHHTIHNLEKRKYIHLFLKYDKNMNLVSFSDSFYFKEVDIEFSLSILYKEETDQVIIPFSYRDNTSEIVKINFDSIKWN